MKGYILTQSFIPDLQIKFLQLRHFRVVTVALYKAVLSLYIWKRDFSANVVD